MIQPIKIIQAIKILKEISTEGSRPLYLIADDHNQYFAKTTVVAPGEPSIELINEMICGYFLKCMDINVPDFALAKIGDEIFRDFENESGPFSERYRDKTFNNRVFFASKELTPTTEIESYFGNGALPKRDYEKINNPLDFIKIGLFDLWVGNKDRKIENPNILLHQIKDKYVFCPIDHTAAFAHCTKYVDVNSHFVFLEDRFRILRMPIVKSIAKIAPIEELQALELNMLDGMNFVLQDIDNIFTQVPPEWGFSRRAKQHLKDFLGDNERNRQIVKTYLGYLK